MEQGIILGDTFRNHSTQAPVQNRVTSEVRAGCSGSYPAKIWKAPRVSILHALQVTAFTSGRSFKQSDYHL